ncbi:tat pathway signal sequence [Colletotrichum paranaense]|uniref:1-alkyl-2-acetylglycerophosphocholine esterase n=1 Tax=Colletotrichum paranaense TaxID=1914294 RepID=A0ABQ9SAW9_9PEZI|nr:tat pathway signal sequence [Colletotrichum paranaense]KAK1531459.1 tat pathway signal sequence [Colletotrichum paranaense]
MLFFIFSSFALMASAVVIPGPPGPYLVALRVKAFEDAARWDPHAPQDQPEKRRVMVSVHVPLKKEAKCSIETVPYVPPTTAVALGQGAATLFGLPDTIFSGMELEFCNIDTPCAGAEKNEEYPLVLFSHGRASSRLAHGVLARSLASYGYIVVTLDHTYDAAIVEFPDGIIRFAENATNSDTAYVKSLLEVSLLFAEPSHVESKILNIAIPQSRQKDVSFIIDQLLDPSVATPLLAGTQASINPEKIFIAGHSFGGATVASSLYVDDRILGGLNFDGQMLGPVLAEGIDKPLVLVGTPTTFDYISGWNETWANLRGPSLMLIVNGTTHMSFFDAPQLPAVKALPIEYSDLIKQVLGTIDDDVLAKIEIELLRRTLDFVLEGHRDALCNIESVGPGVSQLRVKNFKCS